MGEAKRKQEAGYVPDGIKQPNQPQLFIGLPTYGHERHNTIQIVKAITGPKSFAAIALSEVSISLLAMGFNILWTKAIEARDNGMTHFLLLHADIVPLDEDWLVQLHREMVRNNARVISAISPIKDARGLTSIALETENIIAPRRLTMQEVMSNPETFTHPDLLVNTGMLLIDIRPLPDGRDWVREICFTIGDKIVWNPNGKATVGVTPEDWNFSRACREIGIPLFATRKVKLVHMGGFSYPNFTEWGTNAQDQGDSRATGIGSDTDEQPEEEGGEA